MDRQVTTPKQVISPSNLKIVKSTLFKWVDFTIFKLRLGNYVAQGFYSFLHKVTSPTWGPTPPCKQNLIGQCENLR